MSENFNGGERNSEANESSGTVVRPSRRGAKRSRFTGLHVLPLVVLWALPVVAIAVAIPLTAELEVASVSASPPVSVTVGTRELDQAIAVNAVASLAVRPEIRTNRQGVVTALPSPGPIAAGSTLFTVDDVPVLAYRGPVLYRELARGAKGQDVVAMSSFLAGIGLLDPGAVGEEFGADIEQGVGALQATIGVEVDGVFRLSYIAYVPEGATSIAEAAVELGDSVAAGDPVLLAEPPVESIAFIPVAMGGTLAVYEGAELSLRLGPETVDVSGAEVSGAEAHAVAAALDAAVRTGAISAERAEGSPTLYSGSILALRSPTVSGVVPSTAVAVAADGTVCVVVVEGNPDREADRTALVLTRAVPGTEFGTVAIDESAIGLEVVRDISTLTADERSCR